LRGIKAAYHRQIGLEKAIRSHAADFMEKYPNIDIHLALATDFQLLSEDVRLVLFRIYQQSMMNVVRHADAHRVEIRFTFDAEEARLEIEDDGRGFVVPARWITFVRQGHYGLAGMAERVAALNGSFEVLSQPGSGTQLRVIIPRSEGI
jgi:signal transduction histidine kinase